MATTHRSPTQPIRTVVLAALAAAAVVLTWWLVVLAAGGFTPAQPAAVTESAPVTPVIEVERAWARAATVLTGTSAAYMELRNPTAHDDRLLGATTEAAAGAEIHRSSMQAGVMHMEPAGPVAVPAGGSVKLEPGGLHVMLMDLADDLREGGHLMLVLHFERAGDVTVHVPIQGAASTGPAAGR